MELREQIRQWASWPGWRTHAPAAGSVVAHGVVALAIAAMMAASGKPQRARQAPPPAIEVSLIADSLPMPVRPAPKPIPPPKKSEPTPDAAPPLVVAPRRDEKQAATPTVPSTNSDSVYLGPSPFARTGPTGGLEGLANIDPCGASRYGPKAKDCTNWAARVGSMDSAVPRSKEELAAYHGEFMPTCAYAVGCEGGEWISTNGTRSVAGTRMAGGVESVGGITDTVGRLGFNPDHFDRGFGN